MELLCLDFMNSDWRDYRGSGERRDRLESETWLGRFLARWGLEVEAKPSKATLASLGALRATMWRIAEAIAAEQAPKAADLAALNAALESAAVARRLVRVDEAFRLELVAARRDWTWVAGEIAASFGELLAERDPHRLKICDNPDCRWVFYDESKSRTRRWCADVCGNLIKVREFRARQKRPARKR